MRFTKKMKVNASVDKVWTVFAHDFDNAYKWMASVPHSYAKANGEDFDGAQSAVLHEHFLQREYCESSRSSYDELYSLLFFCARMAYDIIFLRFKALAC